MRLYVTAIWALPVTTPRAYLSSRWIVHRMAALRAEQEAGVDCRFVVHRCVELMIFDIGLTLIAVAGIGVIGGHDQFLSLRQAVDSCHRLSVISCQPEDISQDRSTLTGLRSDSLSAPWKRCQLSA